MSRSDEAKWQNVIQRLVNENYKSMSDDTKKNLFQVSNAVFPRKNKKILDNRYKVYFNRSIERNITEVK